MEKKPIQGKGYKFKLPGILMGVEALVILLLFIPMIFGVREHFGITDSLLKGSSKDDAVTGWLVIPALLGDFTVGVAYIASILLAGFFIVSSFVVLGWNMLFHRLNQANRTWMFVVAELPPALIGIALVVIVISTIVQTGAIALVLYASPGLLLLVMVLIQCVKFKMEKFC